MCKILKMLFKRKKYASIYPVGGYPNTSDLYGRARSGEKVVSDKDLRQAIKRSLEDIEEDYPVDAEYVNKRIIECSEAFGVSDKVVEAIGNNLKALQRKQHGNCPSCGAPLHGHKCDYCGTEQ